MIPLDPAPDPVSAERDAIRSDLRNSLSVITGRTQLLQRQVLRSNGLLNLERDQLLYGLAVTLAEVQRVGDQLEGLISGAPLAAQARAEPHPAPHHPPVPARAGEPD
ncbi:MAG: hypothetical protein U0075_13525 [Thermomicrobiales bacterium]